MDSILPRALLVALLLLLLSFWPAAPAPRGARIAGLAAPLPPTTWTTISAQEGETQPGSDKMGHEEWPWGLFGAAVFSGVALSTAIVIGGVVLSWPHRRQ
jgi:hypothetical protein